MGRQTQREITKGEAIRGAIDTLHESLARLMAQRAAIDERIDSIRAVLDFWEAQRSRLEETPSQVSGQEGSQATDEAPSQPGGGVSTDPFDVVGTLGATEAGIRWGHADV